MATIEEREQALNAKCMECRQKHGTPSFDHCNYHCETGKKIRRLDAEKGNGWGNHEHWKKSH